MKNNGYRISITILFWASVFTVLSLVLGGCTVTGKFSPRSYLHTKKVQRIERKIFDPKPTRTDKKQIKLWKKEQTQEQGN